MEFCPAFESPECPLTQISHQNIRHASNTISHQDHYGPVTIKTSVARIVRPQDFVWLLLFSALAYVSTNRHPLEIPILLALAALQALEPKFAYFSTPNGNIVSIVLKLAMSYVLIGYTGGLNSSYYLILLLPLVAAATTLGQVGSAFFTLVCCGAYVSFILFIDQTRYEFDPDQQQEIFLR